MKLTHYSNVGGLTVLDPAEHGTGLLGAEAKRKKAYPEIYLPRTYFGLPGYEKEQGLGDFKYVVNARKGSLYNIEDDLGDLYPTPLQLEYAGFAPFDKDAALCLFEKRIFAAGFEGYFSKTHRIAAKFTKTNV